jgi:hypothetical protein
MINKYNIAELSLVDRPVGGSKSGFGAVIPQHDASFGARYFQTENRDYFGTRVAPGPTQTVANFKRTTEMLAGTNVRPMDEQRTKVISNLVGEIYNKQFDPQEQTDVQRAWLYQQDAAVKAVNGGSARVIQENYYDNANSLPLGEGE